jgi:hypothetical protein
LLGHGSDLLPGAKSFIKVRTWFAFVYVCSVCALAVIDPQVVRNLLETA